MATGARERGVTIVEMMVALLIGLILIAGAVIVYSQSRTTYRTTEAVARLQETARYALDVIENEVRMANFWGLNSRPDYIQNRAAPADPLPTALNTAAAGINTCGANWAINIERYIQAADGYGTVISCQAFNNNPRAGADVLIVRRANDQLPAALAANRMYIQTSRIQGTIFIPSAACTNPLDAACIPGGFAPPLSESHELVANAFYISNDSTGNAGLPSLRRKRLIGGAGGAAIADEEVIPGVEDLQVQYGLDNNGDGNIDRYVTPTGIDLTDPANVVIAVRVWLLVRAENIEVGFTDNAARTFPPGRTVAAPNDNFRRVLVSRTIQLRNTVL
jgi:type IV pilus assembly protein PilW